MLPASSAARSAASRAACRDMNQYSTPAPRNITSESTVSAIPPALRRASRGPCPAISAGGLQLRVASLQSVVGMASEGDPRVRGELTVIAELDHVTIPHRMQ